MIDNISDIIPAVLLASEDYNALNDQQRRDLAARLFYCEEIAGKGTAAATDSALNLLDSIDDIELDALSIISINANADTTFSTYKLHSSWTFECESGEMTRYVRADVVEFLSTSFIGLAAPQCEIKTWLGRWANLIRSILNSFRTANSFAEAIANLIVLDALIACYLLFAAIVRLRE